MAAFDQTRTYSDGYALSTRVYVSVLHLIEAVADWRDAGQTRKTLSALSDRELDDIGLARSDISRVSGFR